MPRSPARAVREGDGRCRHRTDAWPRAAAPAARSLRSGRRSRRRAPPRSASSRATSSARCVWSPSHWFETTVPAMAAAAAQPSGAAGCRVHDRVADRPIALAGRPAARSMRESARPAAIVELSNAPSIVRSATAASKMFIGGSPMKVATNRLAGRSFSSCWRRELLQDARLP